MPASTVAHMPMNKTQTRASEFYILLPIHYQLTYLLHASYDANVDHTMFVLKVIDSSKNPLGMIRYGCIPSPLQLLVTKKLTLRWRGWCILYLFLYTVYVAISKYFVIFGALIAL